MTELYITLSSFSNSSDALSEFPFKDGQKIVEETMRGGNPFVTIDLIDSDLTGEQEQFLRTNPKILFFNTSGFATA